MKKMKPEGKDLPMKNQKTMVGKTKQEGDSSKGIGKKPKIKGQK